MKITEARRKTKAWEMVEEISVHAQSLDPKRDWNESQKAVCDIYKIAHSIRSLSCRKSHPGWCDDVDASIRSSRTKKGEKACGPQL